MKTPTNPSGNSSFLPLQMAHDEATRCIQCGFCLPACPTYKVFGEEKHSPRGRIQLVKAWAEDKTDANADLLTALDLCLDCRACEIACPIDVQYGRILTGARDALNDMAAGHREKPRATPRVQPGERGQPTEAPPVPRTGAKIGNGPGFRWALRYVAAQPKRLRFVTRLARRALHSPPGRWVRRRADNRPDSWLASALTFAQALPEPTAPRGPLSSPVPTNFVTVFLGCAQEGMFPETNDATVDVLRKAGFGVTVPGEQVCCGALHRHHGDKEFARTLLLRNLHVFGAFDETRDDAIVMNAGGCMAWLTEAGELFEPDTEEHKAAERLAARVRDVSEMIYVQDGSGSVGGDHIVDARLRGGGTRGGGARGVEARSGRPGNSRPENARSEEVRVDNSDKRCLRVVYQPSCHLTNVCGINAEPLETLNRITGGCAGLPPDGGSCCGSAGIYNALHPKASRAILDVKMEGIAAEPPDVIVTSNPGCHLQMLAGVTAHGLSAKVRVMQWADFVNEYGTSFQNGDSRSTKTDDVPAEDV